MQALICYKFAISYNGLPSNYTSLFKGEIESIIKKYKNYYIQQLASMSIGGDKLR